MTNPTDPEPAASDSLSANLYDSDFHAWAKGQAALLRAGRFDLADIALIAEEIENLSHNERRELVARVNVLLLLLLKWQYQPDMQGHLWRLTIANARDEVTDHLADNPSLAAGVAETTAAAYRYARRGAAAQTELPEETFPAECPWPFEQIMDPGFWPGGLG